MPHVKQCRIGSQNPHHTQTIIMNKNFYLSLASRWVVNGKIACRSLAPNLVQALGRLERTRLLLQTCFKVKLQPVVRDDWSLKSLSLFCEGIIDSTVPSHEWRSSLLGQHASKRVRIQVATTLFLFRKVVPKEMTNSDISYKIQAYIDKMSTPSPPLDETFINFSKRTLSRLFRPGWDRHWSIHRDNFSLPTRSCLERSRRLGGVRGTDVAKHRLDYDLFTTGTDMSLGLKTNPMMLWTGGKWRLITKFSAKRSYLTPLHRTIYSHLSTKSWLLRGEATPERFDKFQRVDGEVFVSGDYESATDNLNINLTKLIIDEISKTSQHVPPSVWTEARHCLENEFPNGRKQRTGQLMGSLLSFPLLCLANYLTFKFAIPRYVPVKINGDDIVFRCTTAEKERWFSIVKNSGLVVSKGKTLVTKSMFSLNSTFFLSTVSGVEACPVIRSTCLFGECEEPAQISGRLKGVYGGGGIVGEYTRALALREMSKQVYSSQRSLRRGLGSVLTWRTLRWAGMEDREWFYNCLQSEKPLPPRKREWEQNALPEGYARVRVYDQTTDDPEFFREMIQNCWTREPRVGEEASLDEYWNEVRDGTFTYNGPIPLKWWRIAGGKGTPNLAVSTKRLGGNLVWRAQHAGRDVAFCRS